MIHLAVKYIYNSFYYSILYLIIVFPLFTHAQINEKSLDDFIVAEMNKNNIVGASVTVVSKYGPIFTKAYGYKNSSKEEVQLKTKFDIGSMTKSFTALGILQLVNEGFIDLDDYVTDHLPDFTTKNPDYSNQIQIKHLLNHTSGFSTVQGNRMQSEDYDGPDALEVVVKDFKNVKLRYKAGTNSDYSNANYILLGLIIERITGMPYEQYIQKQIFDKINMKNSGFKNNGDDAKPHRYFFGIPIEYVFRNTRDKVSVGGIASSIEDVGKYLSAMLRKDSLLLSSKRFEQFFNLLSKDNNRVGSNGWMTGSVDKNGQEIKFLYHGGNGPGFGSFMALIPELDYGIAVLTNTDGSPFGLTTTSSLRYGVLLNILELPQNERSRTKSIVFIVLWVFPLFFLYKVVTVLKNWRKSGKTIFLLILTIFSLLISYVYLKYLPNFLGGAGIKTVYRFAPDTGLLLILTSIL